MTDYTRFYDEMAALNEEESSLRAASADESEMEAFYARKNDLAYDFLKELKKDIDEYRKITGADAGQYRKDTDDAPVMDYEDNNQDTLYYDKLHVYLSDETFFTMLPQVILNRHGDGAEILEPALNEVSYTSVHEEFFNENPFRIAHEGTHHDYTDHYITQQEYKEEIRNIEKDRETDKFRVFQEYARKQYDERLNALNKAYNDQKEMLDNYAAKVPGVDRDLIETVVDYMHGQGGPMKPVLDNRQNDEYLKTLDNRSFATLAMIAQDEGRKTSAEGICGFKIIDEQGLVSKDYIDNYRNYEDQICESLYLETENYLSVVPNSVTEIGGGAFGHCYSLKTIIIPDGVTEIGKGAFEGCDSLESVTYKGVNIKPLLDADAQEENNFRIAKAMVDAGIAAIRTHRGLPHVQVMYRFSYEKENPAEMQAMADAKNALNKAKQSLLSSKGHILGATQALERTGLGAREGNLPGSQENRRAGEGGR